MQPKTDFILFGTVHWAIIVLIPILAGMLAAACRKWPDAAKPVRLGLGWFLLLNELIWYGWKLQHEGLRFPNGLPLQLCDLTLWVTVLAALTRLQWAYEFSYFVGLSAPVMAILTPELWAPMLSYPTIYFFLAHGIIVVTTLTMTWGRMARPQPGCLWRTFGILNGWAVLVGCFNAVYHTNYMYLCQKPGAASALDFLGPWPVYILAGQTVALVLFTLLWLPFRAGRSQAASAAGARA